MTPFSQQLSWWNAFYRQPGYMQNTRAQLESNERAPVVYTKNSELVISRIAKEVLEFVVFPVKLYRWVHSLVGKLAILPASTPTLMGVPGGALDRLRANAMAQGGWKVKRITIAVDGYHIDAMIVGKSSTLGNGKWMLSSLGNGQFYEVSVAGHGEELALLKATSANGLFFNYPGVGSSSGLPSRKAMVKAYRAMLSFLEDQEKGIGAKRIIGYGHSIGGGVQGDALRDYQLRNDISYVFVKGRTFSDLSTTASQLLAAPIGGLVRLLGWNLSSVDSSKDLQAPEIILQTANTNRVREITRAQDVKHDGVIPAEASLARELLLAPQHCARKKVVLGIPETHNQTVKDVKTIGRHISTALGEGWFTYLFGL